MLNGILRNLLFTASAAAGLLWLSAGAASATTLTYTPQFWGHGSPSDFSMTVTFDDSVAGKPDAIKGTVTLTPGRYTGDIVGFFFDLEDWDGKLKHVAKNVDGPDVRDVKMNTPWVQGLPWMPHVFDIGVEIGTVLGPDDIQSTDIFLNTPGLTLSNLGKVGVQVMWVGDDCLRLDTRILLDKTGDMTATPEPGTWALLLSGGALVALGRKLRKS